MTQPLREVSTQDIKRIRGSGSQWPLTPRDEPERIDYRLHLFDHSQLRRPAIRAHREFRQHSKTKPMGNRFKDQSDLVDKAPPRNCRDPLPRKTDLPFRISPEEAVAPEVS